MTGVLIGIDGSDASMRAVDFAVEMAREFDLGLIVVHVIPWSPYSFSTPDENARRHAQRAQEIASAQEQVIQPALARIAEAGVRSEGVVRHGHAVEVMTALALKRGVRHIIVGRTGDSRVKQILFGSTPSQLVVSSPVPVTVVP